LHSIKASDRNILNNNRKRKADNSFNCRYYKVHVSKIISGEDFRNVKRNKQAKLEEYYNIEILIYKIILLITKVWILRIANKVFNKRRRAKKKTRV